MFLGVVFLMLDIASLYFDYQDNPLLQDVHFSLDRGQFLHLKGANGVGKTTLLKLIAGLWVPHQGSIQWQGVNIHHDLSAFHQVMCFVGHKSGCHGGLSVLENCRLDVNYRSDTDVTAALAAFDLLARSHQRCSTLSVGQLRRLSLVRLLMRKTTLWILDESFASLDPHGVDLLCRQICLHVRHGGIVVATAHHALPQMDIDISEYYLS